MGTLGEEETFGARRPLQFVVETLGKKKKRRRMVMMMGMRKEDGMLGRRRLYQRICQIVCQRVEKTGEKLVTLA